MKINSLRISKYKNLPDTINFDANLITLLVGQNGLGKSNLLEVLASIFSYLYGVALGWEKVAKEMMPKFDFAIDYECCGNRILAILRDGRTAFYSLSSGIKPLPIKTKEYQDNHKLYLPSQLFVYYSGENKRIGGLYKSFTHTEHDKRRTLYKKGELVEVPRHIITLNNDHGTFILLTLLIYRYHPSYEQVINQVLKDVLRIDVSDTVEIQLQSPTFAKISELENEGKLAGDMIDSSTGIEYANNEETIFWGIRGGINDFLYDITQYAMSHSTPFKHHTEERGKSKRKEFLDFNGLVMGKELSVEIYQHFSSPLDFFNMLNEMNSLNMIQGLSFHISKTDDKVTSFPFSQLSEGEQQYLTVMGMIAMNRGVHNETLYLLDEPDTHINPKWQRHYIQSIENLIDEDSKPYELFFISTHSPFLVQSYNKKNVSMMLFKLKEGKVVIEKDDYTIKNWSIDQVLLSEYFDFISTRSIGHDQFVKRRNAIVEKGALNEDDIKFLEDTIKEEGYLPTGESLNDIKVMASLHKMYEELK